MFLDLNHQKLDIYEMSRKLVKACYDFSNLLPKDEKFAMISQIRRAALSVHLNIAEGCSRTSGAERKRFFEIARGSLIEIDAALDIALDLKYITQNPEDLKEPLTRCFKMLTGLISANVRSK